MNIEIKVNPDCLNNEALSDKTPTELSIWALTQTIDRMDGTTQAFTLNDYNGNSVGVVYVSHK